MAEQPKFTEELKKMAGETLLPVEKKLIGWSIGLGVVLSAVAGRQAASPSFPGLSYQESENIS